MFESRQQNDILTAYRMFQHTNANFASSVALVQSVFSKSSKYTVEDVEIALEADISASCEANSK